MYEINGNTYTDIVESTDWRYSAAIVGLCKYLEFYNAEFDYDADSFYYNRTDITEERYLNFVEHYFEKDMYHKIAENYLKGLSEFSDDKIKEINNNLNGNSIMKKVLNKKKFDGTNTEEILKIIDDNRQSIIKETFKNKSNLYDNFGNGLQLFNEGSKCCRLWGYYADMNRKGKALSYNFDISKFVKCDDKLFDFVPFAFAIGKNSAVFINDNITIKHLIDTNYEFRENVIDLIEEENGNVLQVMFSLIVNSSKFLDYDVEVIYKDRDKKFFETLILRKKSIEILKKLKFYKIFCWSYKVNENYYINIQQVVTDAVINLTNVTELIQRLLNDENKNRNNKYNNVISRLIEVNILIKGDDKMKNSTFRARKTAQDITEKLKAKNAENKLRSYRTRLTSALVFRDYKKFNDTLLQLSNYVSDVDFSFAYSLFEDFEENESVAYSFVNGLGEENSNNEYNNEIKEA